MKNLRWFRISCFSNNLGTKRIKNIGTDLGGAIKSFRKGLNEAESAESELSQIGEELNKDPIENEADTEENKND